MSSKRVDAGIPPCNDGPDYSVPALEKGLDILECLARQETALTQAQLARALGRGTSELFRSLATLERRGYVRRDPASGAYGLTLRLYELGHVHSPHEGLVRAAERPMRLLTEEIRQSCHLSVIDRGRLLVLHQEESPTRVRLSVEVGSTVPILDAASGRLLLANLDEAVREAILARDTAFPRLSAGEQAALRERLASIRQREHETAVGETVEGVTDLAVPVGRRDGRVRAALTVAALTRDPVAFVETALPALRRSADEIARSAGLVAPEEGVAVGAARTDTAGAE